MTGGCTGKRPPPDVRTGAIQMDRDRFWLAGMAMQGLLVNDDGDSVEGTVHCAAAYADALLAELNKELETDDD